MRILLINHYAGSPEHGMEYRPYYLAREWIKMGHEVHIVAASWSHLRSMQPELVNNRQDTEISGILYTWFLTPPYTGNGVGRVRNMATFVWRLFLAGKTIAAEFKPDVVIASSTYPMDIWPARRIARFANAKLVYEVHDLWPLSPIELGGMPHWHPFIMLVQAAENYAYRNVDVVVSMLPKVKKYMESRGLAPSKLHIVPNGIDPAEWEGQGSELANDLHGLFDKLRDSGCTIVGYAGAHGVANALDSLLEVAQCMQNENVVFVLVGNGSEKSALMEQAEAMELENIRFVDPVSKSQIPALLKQFDIAYIGLQSQPLFKFGIAPNKLMDYMMAARPVIMAIDAGNDPVSEAGCGVTVAPENPDEIRQGLHKLLSLSASEREAMGKRGREYVIQRHSYPVLARQFAALLEQA
jgi:glycosyltransferase involved in cell wall biosynthesis